MKQAKQRGVPALDLLEEAVQLLRGVPLRLLLTYYAGAIPFVLGLLYFWADMSVGALAERHCAASAAGLVALFLWLKCWQNVFVCGLRARIAAVPPKPWSLRRVLRALLKQGVVQPSKFFLLPLALVATFPFAWTFAFYENALALDDGESSSVRALVRRAAAQARIWPGQNHMLIALLGLLGFGVWLNAVIGIASLPQLAKMFLGIETVFTRAGKWSFLNTTFLAATVALAWLAVDPLIKTIYALRAFYGEARVDGADLLAELAVVRGNGKAFAIVAMVLLLTIPTCSWAQKNGSSPEPARVANSGSEVAPVVTPEKLNDAVKQTLAQDKYAWRLPREPLPKTSNPVKGWLRGLFEGITDTLLKWARGIRDFIRTVMDWFGKVFAPKSRSRESGDSKSSGWIFVLRGFAYVLLVLAAAALAILLWRVWKQRGRIRSVVVAEVLPTPDVADENVTASQLPEDGWLKLARELMDKGDLRLALRALYLASLAHLATREVVSIARFKSNRDYETEVNRRARGSPELRAAFSENVMSFDRAWYGLYDVSVDVLQKFQGNLERIRTC